MNKFILVYFKYISYVKIMDHKVYLNSKESL